MSIAPTDTKNWWIINSWDNPKKYNQLHWQEKDNIL
jgi:hypothetical protein